MKQSSVGTKVCPCALHESLASSYRSDSTFSPRLIVIAKQIDPASM